MRENRMVSVQTSSSSGQILSAIFGSVHIELLSIFGFPWQCLWCQDGIVEDLAQLEALENEASEEDEG